MEKHLRAPMRRFLKAVFKAQKLLRQAGMNRRLELADAAAGRVQPMDAAYFERLWEHVRRVAGKG